MKKKLMGTLLAGTLSVTLLSAPLQGSLSVNSGALPTAGNLGSSTFGTTPNFQWGSSGMVKIPLSSSVTGIASFQTERMMSAFPGGENQLNNNMTARFGVNINARETTSYAFTISPIHLQSNNGGVNGVNVAVTGLENSSVENIWSYSYGLGYTMLTPSSSATTSFDNGSNSEGLSYDKGVHATSWNGYFTTAYPLSGDNNIVGSGISFLVGSRGYNALTTTYHYYNTATPWIGGSDYITLNPFNYSYMFPNLKGVTLSLSTGINWLNTRACSEQAYSSDFFVSPTLTWSKNYSDNWIWNSSVGISAVQPLATRYSQELFYSGVLTTGLTYQF